MADSESRLNHGQERGREQRGGRTSWYSITQSFRKKKNKNALFTKLKKKNE